MQNRLQLSIKLIKEATDALMQKVRAVKKEEQEIIKEANKEKSEQKIKELKDKLGI